MSATPGQSRGLASQWASLDGSKSLKGLKRGWSLSGPSKSDIDELLPTQTPKVKDSDPLHRFGKAKKKAGDIFNRLNDALSKVLVIYQNTTEKTEKEKIENFVNQARGIGDVIKRNSMKVVFFGRPSNGKSSCINAMLHEQILPTGIGHTTSCFCSVQGTDDPDAPYLFIPGSDERMNVGTVQQLTNSLHEEQLQSDSIVKVFWPRNKCRLLAEDVELVDSPGIGIDPDFDKWIDKVCTDADVFIFVSNAESTLMTPEKQFFHRVSERLSKPNIFILNNRWDASAGESSEVVAKVRQQHMDRDKDFLINSLKVVDSRQADNRIFFVSAKEVLQCRTEGFESLKAEGSHARLAEFEMFEKKFEECLSESAISTRFKLHVENGLSISREIKLMLEQMEKAAKTKKEECTKTLHERVLEVSKLEGLTDQFQKDWDQKIDGTTKGVQNLVKQAMEEEVHRLREFVNGFTTLPFSVDNLESYINGLYEHLESQLDENLMSRCNSSVSKSMKQTQQAMLDNVQSAIPQHLEIDMSNVVSSDDLSLSYELDFKQICYRFRPDLKFKFSWGLTVIRHWMGPHFGVASVFPVTSGEDSGDGDSILQMFFQKFSSQSVWPAITLGVGVWQTISWKGAVMLGAGIFSLYIYERLCWTTRAQEDSFKEQFVGFAAEKFNTAVAVKSKDCQHQVKRELNQSVLQLRKIVSSASEHLEEEASHLKEDINMSEEREAKAKNLKQQMKFYESELSKFEDDFILSVSLQ